MEYQLALISHQIDNAHIPQREKDGFVNATAMCKAAGKLFGHYNSLQTTKDFLAALSSDIGIPISGLIVTLKGGANPLAQGTWVHPDVAVHLAQWCSPKFAVAVSRWVREWMKTQAKGSSLPYHLRRYVANMNNVPPGHFSILNEMIAMVIGPMEAAGYTLPEHMLPDSSEGRIFCRWLREEMSIDTDRLPKYEHGFEDGRRVPANAYPDKVLADFRKHVREEWLPKKAKKYFEDRDPAALPFLSTLLLANAVPALKDQAKPAVSRVLGAERMRELRRRIGGPGVK